MSLFSEYSKIGNKRYYRTLFENREGDDKDMRMFLRQLTELIKRPAFSSKWFAYSFGFSITGQFLDGLATKFGLDLGLNEVSTYGPNCGAQEKDLTWNSPSSCLSDGSIQRMFLGGLRNE